MRIIFVSPKRELIFEDVKVLSLPCAKGKLQIMNGHAPLLAELVKGKVVIESKSKEDSFDIIDGFAEVHKNEITLLIRDEKE